MLSYCFIGNFGVGIASFFVFTRLVITLNIVLAVLWTTFVILPGVITYDSSEVITKGLKEEILGEEEEFHVRHLFDGRVWFITTFVKSKSAHESFMANNIYFYYRVQLLTVYYSMVAMYEKVFVTMTMLMVQGNMTHAVIVLT